METTALMCVSRWAHFCEREIWQQWWKQADVLNWNCWQPPPLNSRGREVYSLGGSQHVVRVHRQQALCEEVITPSCFLSQHVPLNHQRESDLGEEMQIKKKTSAEKQSFALTLHPVWPTDLRRLPKQRIVLLLISQRPLVVITRCRIPFIFRGEYCTTCNDTLMREKYLGRPWQRGAEAVDAVEPC